MKVKIISIMLLLFSMATPVVVTMAIPKKAEPFNYKAVMNPYFLEDWAGAQKYTQYGVLRDEDNEVVGSITLDILITNANKYLSGGTARARVHFFMDFDARPDITGIIVGKTSLDITTEPWTQDIEGKFVGRGSHVKGTISLESGDPNVLLFSGMEW